MNMRMAMLSQLYILIYYLVVTPRLKSRRGIAMSMSVRPSLPPSVCRHFTLLAVQGAFLHQLSPFLVCRLVIRLFCGSFNDFEKISFFGSKTAKLGTENMHFQYKSVFSSAGHVSSPIITIFGLQACYNVISWKF